MSERDLIAFLFRTMLEDEFGSKTGMAEELGIPFRTVQWVFQHLETAKGASTTYQRLLWHCCEQDIDMTDLFRRFKSERREEGWMGMGVKRVRRVSDADQEDQAGVGLEKVYEVFDLLLRTVCETCAQKQAGGVQADCAVTRLADALAERREAREQTIKKEEEMGKKEGQHNIGIVRGMTLVAFNEYFQGNHATMAAALQLPEEDIKRALEIEQWRSSAAVFEKLAAYCLHNGISLDGLLSRYAR